MKQEFVPYMLFNGIVIYSFCVHGFDLILMSFINKHKIGGCIANNHNLSLLLHNFK